MAGPITYIPSITGDCSNKGQGAISLAINGGTSPYTVNWVSPNLGSDNGVTSSFRNNLTYGAYFITITDSNPIQQQSLSVKVNVSDGVCVNIVDESGANCGPNSGFIRVLATSSSSNITYKLYQYDTITKSSVLVSTSQNNTFTNLNSGVYYVVAIDDGGCSGSTATCVIKESQSFNFGLYVVNPSSCTSNSGTGSIYVTGTTGTPPITYLWSNGQTTSYITGLTEGDYSVIVTDSNGCTKTEYITLSKGDPLGVLYQEQSPTCLNYDGQIVVTVTGGTPPFYYRLSNGDNQILFSRTITYNGLGSNLYTLTVSDASLCEVSVLIDLKTIGFVSEVNISTVNASCGNNNGIINIQTIGGSLSTNLRLNYPDGSFTLITATNYSFTNLSAGIYEIVVTDSSFCTYSESIEILNLSLFTITTNVQNVACNSNTGIVSVTVSETGNYTYQVEGYLGTFEATIFDKTFEVYGLSPGPHTIFVTLSNLSGSCTVQKTFLVQTTEQLSLSLVSTSCGTGSEGTITAYISGGVPPFIFSWSPNVGSQTGLFVQGLDADTYSLTITDSNGCQKTEITTITCRKRRGRGDTLPTVTDYTYFTVCEDVFHDSFGHELGIIQMFYDGYLTLLSGQTGCNLLIATYMIYVIVDGVVYTALLYTSSGPYDLPTNSDYILAVKNLIKTIPGLGAVIFDEQTNTFILNSDCCKTVKDITIKLRINYLICCRVERETICFAIMVNGDAENLQFVYGSIITTYNGKVAYELFINGSSIGFVFWNSNTNRWEFWSQLGPSGTFYAYLDNGLDIPITTPVYQWISVNSTYVIIESGGNCLQYVTTTTTPFITPTATGPIVTPTATGPIVTPTVTGPIVTPTATGPIVTPTATGPIVTPTATGPIVTPTATGPTPTPTLTTTTTSPVCYCFDVTLIEFTTTTTTFDCSCIFVTYFATTTTTTPPPPTTTTTTFKDCHCILVTYSATTSTTTSPVCYCYDVTLIEFTTTTTTFDCRCILVTYFATTTTTISPPPVTTTTTFDCHCILVIYNEPPVTTTTTRFVTTTTSRVTTSTTTGLICLCYDVTLIEIPTTTTTTLDVNCYEVLFYDTVTTTTTECDCTCHIIDNRGNGAGTINWSDCLGIVTFNYVVGANNLFSICAQQVNIQTGSMIITNTQNNCQVPQLGNECQCCDCWELTYTSGIGASIIYSDCNGIRQTIDVNDNTTGTITVCASRVPGGINLTITDRHTIAGCQFNGTEYVCSGQIVTTTTTACIDYCWYVEFVADYGDGGRIRGVNCDGLNLFSGVFYGPGQVYFCSSIQPYPSSNLITFTSTPVKGQPCVNGSCPTIPTTTTTTCACCCYSVENPTNFNEYFDYDDCLGNQPSVIIPPNTTQSYCCQTVYSNSNLIITNTGGCSNGITCDT